jgi:hypothetical protein
LEQTAVSGQGGQAGVSDDGSENAAAGATGTAESDLTAVNPGIGALDAGTSATGSTALANATASGSQGVSSSATAPGQYGVNQTPVGVTVVNSVRLFAIPLIGIVLVAIFTVHFKYGFSSIKSIGLNPDGPIFGPPGYEVALLYIAGIICLALGGAGRYSVDSFLGNTRNESSA